MKKYLILCYSKTGNSRFMAGELAKELHCDVQMIKPMFDYTGLLFLISFLKIPIPVNIAKDDIRPYQEIIIVGPIWGGLVVAPLKSVLKKCIALKKQIHFAVTCETKESDSSGEYGYDQVLNSVRMMGGSLVKNTAAFSTSLIIGYDGKINTDMNTKAKITEENFSADLKSRLDDFIQGIRQL